MESPTHLDRCLAILILRTLQFSQDEVINVLHCHKQLVSMVDRWFSEELNYPAAVKVCADIAIKSALHLFLVPSKDIDPETLVKAAQLTADDILRHYRKDHIKEEIKKVENKPMEFHLAQLANIAKILAHHAKRLIDYTDDDDIEDRGNVLGHLTLWRKLNNTKVTEGTSASDEHIYDEKHPIDPYLATCLYTHYIYRFGKLPFEKWNNLSMRNVRPKIVDNLERLAYAGLEPCPDCPICKEIMD